MSPPHTRYGLEAITHTGYEVDAISKLAHPQVVSGLCRDAFNSHTHSKGQTRTRLLILIPYMDIRNLDLCGGVQLTVVCAHPTVCLLHTCTFVHTNSCWYREMHVNKDTHTHTRTCTRTGTHTHTHLNIVHNVGKEGCRQTEHTPPTSLL